jgi:protoheme ferro-lyase
VLGVELERIDSLNDDPEFVRALAEIVEERLAVSGKRSG